MHESSEEFEFLPDPTTDCGVSCPERLKNPHRLIMENWCCHVYSAMLDQISFILPASDDIHKSLDEFEIRPDLIRDHRVSCS